MKNDKEKGFLIPGWVLVLLSAGYGELMLHFWTNAPLIWSRIPAVLLFALGFGCVLALIASLFSGKIQKCISVIMSLLLAVFFLTAYFIWDSFQVFMTISTILSGANGVASDFMSTVLHLLLHEWWRILVMLLPAVLYAVFARCGRCCRKLQGILAGAAIIAYLAGFGAVYLISGDGSLLQDTYNFDSAVHAFGLNMALPLEAFQNSSLLETPEFEAVESDPAPSETTAPESASTEATSETVPEETAPAVVYSQNVMNMDFAALAETEKNPSIADLHRYVAGLTPSMENEYTGLFRGKNLIFISAEAFSAEVIDPDLTPTLYRLANQGIKFHDYYQPNWGGGTSAGEFANVVGFAGRGGCMQEAVQQNLFLTMGHQLQRLGYRSASYHNNSYTFYNRDATHPKLGYDFFMGYGNGLEDGITPVWPESDLEMFQFTIPQYLEGDQPFNLYYMSVSGHSHYNLGGNAMSRKNYDVVRDLPRTEEVKCYLACNLELEYAMEYLVKSLEDSGIADDTVIVLGADHYPYGLEQSATWGCRTDQLKELFGYPVKNEFDRDHNALIIWSGCLEGKNIEVKDPVYSLDILPTLSNLFGVDFDSRLLIGRDVLSDAEPIILWNTYAWKTDKGCYTPGNHTFTPAEGVTVGEGYVERISAIVKNKLRYSNAVLANNYFNYLPAPAQSQSAD